MLQTRGGLQEADIIGIFADETEAKEAAKGLLGMNIVRPEDSLAVQVLVNVMVAPTREGMTFKELSAAVVEAVTNAVRHAEQDGFQHGLVGQVSMGAGPVELNNEFALFGSVV